MGEGLKGHTKISFMIENDYEMEQCLLGRGVKGSNTYPALLVLFPSSSYKLRKLFSI